MLRRLRPRLRPLLHRRYSSHAPPLNILFAGSDDFSITCLQHLHAEAARNPSLISSLTVLHRPAALTGRRRSILKEVPIVSAAEQLRLPHHAVPDISTYTAPADTSLLIAVSFGLFIPARLLTSLPYGGLNVHPSLLPRYRGAAPIHHTLLNGDKYTGVTVQTLDLERFDHGKILAQSQPEIAVGGKGYGALRGELAEEGGRLLVEVLREGRFRDAAYPGLPARYEPSVARKVGDREKRIDWAAWGKRDFVLRAEMFGDVYGELGFEHPEKLRTRCLLKGVGELEESDAVVDREMETVLGGKPEVGMVGKYGGRRGAMVVRTKDGWVSVGTVQLEGKKEVEGGLWAGSLKVKRRFW